jgi:DNA-binding transcriptional LysR family regulator
MWSIDMLLHVRAFVTVAELESFSRAAEELLIGQPLLSRRIKSLEAEVGGELFDRSKRQIAVTELGRTLLDPARDLLARAELFEEFVRMTQGRDRLRLGMPPDCDPRAIARIVTRAAEDGQRIDVVELAGLARDRAFDDGALDAVLLRKPADAAGFVVELGLASAQPIEQAGGSASGGATSARALQLETLRQRRGAGAARRHILVSAEDDRPVFINNLTRAAAHAGLTGAQIEIGMPASSALVRVLAGGDVLLCARQLATRNGLAWAPLADRTIGRTYQLAVAASLQHDASVHGLMARLAPLLGSAVDAVQASRRGMTDTGAHPLVEAWG